MNFSGTVSSDFMKLVQMPENKKANLINFAATDFLSIKTSLINYIKAVYPLEYQYFVESDLGMMFIELIAYQGAVMSMKADMLANENFLMTASQRSSVKKLLQLIGVRMRGPLSAATDAQITFDTGPDGVGYPYVLTPANRVVSVTSPEDGAAVSYTLYKVINGFVDLANNNGYISLYANETDNPDTSSIYSNLVLQEGALITDSGEFAATEAIKSISLTQNPVVEGSIQVFINSNSSNSSGAFTEVDNIYFASGTSDKIFEVVYDENYAANIVFGDGVVGVSPDDSASYFITYRVGGGSRGNIAKNAINAAITATSRGADEPGTITNISVGVGGSNAETIENAKKWAPLTFRRQDRLVTLEDYTVFANTFISTWGTIGKATTVTRKAYSSANTLDVYVLEKASDLQLQKATPSFKTELLTAINKKKMATDEIVVVDGLIRTFDLVVTIRIDKEQQPNQAQVIYKTRNIILNYLNVDNRSFGQKLIIGDLNRAIFELDEVRYSTIDNLSQDVDIDFNEIMQLNNLTVNVTLLD